MTTRSIAGASMVLALIACTGDSPIPQDGRPPVATLLAQNVELIPGAGSAVRLGFDAFEDAAQVIVSTTPPTAVTVCPLTAMDGDLPPIEDCARDIASGVREPVGASQMRAIAIVSSGPDSIAANIRVEYEATSRKVEILLPIIRAPGGQERCVDNACNPFFELTPTRGGPFSASATWSGPDATLVLLQGGVLGRSQTATGLAYAEPARANGASPLRITTTMSEPGEYALALRAGPADRLTDVGIQVEWPG